MALNWGYVLENVFLEEVTPEVNSERWRAVTNPGD